MTEYTKPWHDNIKDGKTWNKKWNRVDEIEDYHRYLLGDDPEHAGFDPSTYNMRGCIHKPQEVLALQLSLTGDFARNAEIFGQIPIDRETEQLKPSKKYVLFVAMLQTLEYIKKHYPAIGKKIRIFIETLIRPEMEILDSTLRTDVKTNQASYVVERCEKTPKRNFTKEEIDIFTMEMHDFSELFDRSQMYGLRLWIFNTSDRPIFNDAFKSFLKITCLAFEKFKNSNVNKKITIVDWLNVQSVDTSGNRIISQEYFDECYFGEINNGEESEFENTIVRLLNPYYMLQGDQVIDRVPVCFMQRDIHSYIHQRVLDRTSVHTTFTFPMGGYVHELPIASTNPSLLLYKVFPMLQIFEVVPEAWNRFMSAGVDPFAIAGVGNIHKQRQLIKRSGEEVHELVEPNSNNVLGVTEEMPSITQMEMEDAYDINVSTAKRFLGNDKRDMMLFSTKKKPFSDHRILNDVTTKHFWAHSTVHDDMSPVEEFKKRIKRLNAGFERGLKQQKLSEDEIYQKRTAQSLMLLRKYISELRDPNRLGLSACHKIMNEYLYSQEYKDWTPDVKVMQPAFSNMWGFSNFIAKFLIDFDRHFLQSGGFTELLVGLFGALAHTFYVHDLLVNILLIGEAETSKSHLFKLVELLLPHGIARPWQYHSAKVLASNKVTDGAVDMWHEAKPNMFSEEAGDEGASLKDLLTRQLTTCMVLKLGNNGERKTVEYSHSRIAVRMFAMNFVTGGAQDIAAETRFLKISKERHQRWNKNIDDCIANMKDLPKRDRDRMNQTIMYYRSMDQMMWDINYLIGTGVWTEGYEMIVSKMLYKIFKDELSNLGINIEHSRKMKIWRWYAKIFVCAYTFYYFYCMPSGPRYGQKYQTADLPYIRPHLKDSFDICQFTFTLLRSQYFRVGTEAKILVAVEKTINSMGSDAKFMSVRKYANVQIPNYTDDMTPVEFGEWMQNKSKSERDQKLAELNSRRKDIDYKYHVQNKLQCELAQKLEIAKEYYPEDTDQLAACNKKYTEAVMLTMELSEKSGSIGSQMDQLKKYKGKSNSTLQAGEVHLLDFNYIWVPDSIDGLAEKIINHIPADKGRPSMAETIKVLRHLRTESKPFILTKWDRFQTGGQLPESLLSQIREVRVCDKEKYELKRDEDEEEKTVMVVKTNKTHSRLGIRGTIMHYSVMVDTPPEEDSVLRTIFGAMRSTFDIRHSVITAMPTHSATPHLMRVINVKPKDNTVLCHYNILQATEMDNGVFNDENNENDHMDIVFQEQTSDLDTLACMRKMAALGLPEFAQNERFVSVLHPRTQWEQCRREMTVLGIKSYVYPDDPVHDHKQKTLDHDAFMNGDIDSSSSSRVKGMYTPTPKEIIDETSQSHKDFAELLFVDRMHKPTLDDTTNSLIAGRKRSLDNIGKHGRRLKISRKKTSYDVHGICNLKMDLEEEDDDDKKKGKGKEEEEVESMDLE